ncbi:hypothetical protein ILUMI_08778 [Ignelater luminosus]|uniref:Uncharacterized protein n=1 Tax=Ignelater luminosus TaxID=2038154 RepID=A0A8K0D705_IGNLU|nr:hypothetical protein ILUMI_08778 [Ignelater luminosus]
MLKCSYETNKCDTEAGSESDDEFNEANKGKVMRPTKRRENESYVASPTDEDTSPTTETHPSSPCVEVEIASSSREVSKDVDLKNIER